MLKIRIIPCMLFDGMLIIKTKRFGERRKLGSPIQFTKVYNSRNVDELIFLDMTATEQKRDPAYEIIKEVSEHCFMPLSIGGGIKSVEIISNLLKVGADKVVINSSAVLNPELITEGAERFGSQCIVVSIDAKKDENGKYCVYANSGKDFVTDDLAGYIKKMERLGAGEFFLNSIDNDGMMGGFDNNLLALAVKNSSVPVIGCGGAGKPEHFVEAMQKTGPSALAAASIFHYTQYTPNDIKRELQKNNYNVRFL